MWNVERSDNEARGKGERNADKCDVKWSSGETGTEVGRGGDVASLKEL